MDELPLRVTAAHGIVLAVVLLSVAVYFCYGYAPAITARVSPQTAHARDCVRPAVRWGTNHLEWGRSLAEEVLES